MQSFRDSVFYSLGLGLALTISCLRLFEKREAGHSKTREIRARNKLRLLSPPLQTCSGLFHVTTFTPQCKLVYHASDALERNSQPFKQAEDANANHISLDDDNASSTNSWAEEAGSADDFVYSHKVSISFSDLFMVFEAVCTLRI